MADTSRNPSDMHPLLLGRWDYMVRRWVEKHPDLPVPFLTATYRGPIDQLASYAGGASKAMFGQSLHNFKPCFAFDVAFLSPLGGVDWSFHLFEKMAVFGDECGLEWGGRWPGLVDGPHFQLPMTIEDAKAGRFPFLKPIPGAVEIDGGGWKVVVLTHGVVRETYEIDGADDVVVRYSAGRKRVYLDVKKEVPDAG